MILFIIIVTTVAFLWFVVPAKAEASGFIRPNHSMFRDSLSNVHIVGEVQNIGDVPVNLTRVTVTFLDAQNNPISPSKSEYTKLNVILPRRTAPFKIVFPDSAGKVANYVFSSPTFTSTTAKPIGLNISSTNSYLDSGGWMHVAGTIKNTASINATFVKIVATFYNKTTGKVVGVADGYLATSTLEANQTANFDVQVSGVKVPSNSSSVVTAESMEFLSETYSAALVDRTPPDIISVAWNPQSPNSTQSVDVSASVVEPGYASGVKNVTLWYAVDDALTFQPISMQWQNGQWRATIPAQNGGVTVQFFVKAFDNEQNGAMYPSPPYGYTVVNESVASPFPLELAVALVIVVAIIVGILIKYRRKLR